WLRPVHSWAAAVVALLIIASPIALLYQGIVWKDVLFADATAGGFATLAWLPRVWNTPWRFVAMAKAMVLLCLAAMARQNGLLCLACGVIALTWIASQHTQLRTALIYGAAALAFAAVFTTAANVALGTRIVAPSGPAKQFRLLQLYDIIGFVAADKTIALTVLHDQAPDLEREVRSDGVRLYNPQRNDPLAGSQPLQSALEDAPWSAVRGQWLSLIVHHPWTYVKIRAEVFRWIFATPDIDKCLPYLVGISGPEPQMEKLGIEERDDDRDDALAAYASVFIKTPVLSHVFYALLSIGCLVLLLRRRRGEDIAIAALQAGVLLFTLSFIVIGIACDYRYLYALDIASLVGVFYIACDWSNLLPTQTRLSSRPQ
ncbi:MAG TPA: hypothetical protein VHL34_18885, partial [Rhizomicrobium sp.]|nr:hypothetical protein [Rhizomicrobium sp.]